MATGNAEGIVTRVNIGQSAAKTYIVSKVQRLDENRSEIILSIILRNGR